MGDGVGEAGVKTLVKSVKMGVESRRKMVGWDTRGGESESDVGVGVTLEVGLHRLKKKLKWW